VTESGGTESPTVEPAVVKAEVAMIEAADELALDGAPLGRADAPEAEPATEESFAPASTANTTPEGLEHLVPALGDPWKMAAGRRPFQHKVSFSPGYGSLGDKRLYAWRFAYNPNAWLGWEAAIEHTPGDAVHAALHTISGMLRYPLPWRLQPYVAGGYGFIMVFPGEVVNADPVTENVLTGGGGLELYIRDDVAIRAEMRRTTVIGGQRDREGTVAYEYAEATIGFAFYRQLNR
jgi:hypothetical protein